MGGGYFPNSGRPPGGQFLSYSFSSLVPVRHWARDPALRSWPVLLLAALVCHPVHLAFPHRPDRPRHVGRHHRVFHWPGHHRSEPEVFGRLRRDRHRGRPAWPQRLERDQRPSRLGPDHADQRAAFPGLRPGRSLASRAAAGVRLVPGPRAVPAHAPGPWAAGPAGHMPRQLTPARQATVPRRAMAPRRCRPRPPQPTAGRSRRSRSKPRQPAPRGRGRPGGSTRPRPAPGPLRSRPTLRPRRPTSPQRTPPRQAAPPFRTALPPSPPRSSASRALSHGGSCSAGSVTG
jgi:hypothetical protein